MGKKISEIALRVGRFATKYSSCALSAVALMAVTAAMGRCCVYCLHQPEVPAEAKKYRKF